jgi:hypothetical protein
VLSITLLQQGLKLGRASLVWTCSCDWDSLEITVGVDVTGETPRITLKHLSRNSSPEEQYYSVSLTRTYPHLGGVRWWFQCPQTLRRVSKLYLPIGGRRFLSRQAYRLVHNTRQMSTAYRQSHRVNKISARLGSPDCSFLDPPGKPPRMRWQSYERLVAEWKHARDAYWDTLNRGLVRRPWFKSRFGAIDFG